MKDLVTEFIEDNHLFPGQLWAVKIVQTFDDPYAPNRVTAEVVLPVAGQYRVCWMNVHTEDTFGGVNHVHGDLPSNWTY